MNLTLFRSWYAALVVLAVAAVLAASALGSVDELRWLRLTSGLAALVCMALALAYVVRKYMHKYGYSPEFKLRVPIASLERAERRLNELRGQVLAKRFASVAEVRRAVDRALAEERVQRVLKIDVKPGPAGGPPFVLELNKAFMFGRTAKWLHLHVYVSVAFALFVLQHAGSQLGADLGGVLIALSLWVVVTGLVGIALWTFGPRWLSRRERDLSIEESFVLHEGFRNKLAQLRTQLASDGELVTLLDEVVARGPQASAAALQAAARFPDERRKLFQDACVLAGQARRVDVEFRALWRIRLSFMAWRAAHIPAAVLLLFAVTAHLVTIWIY